jgi:hypothetical protein
MAKKAAPKKVVAAKKVVAEKPAFGVDYIAEKLGIQPPSARIRLRNAEIEREGKTYGWASKKAADEVVNRLKSSGE